MLNLQGKKVFDEPLDLFKVFLTRFGTLQGISVLSFSE
jgi:hypothetical protein